MSPIFRRRLTPRRAEAPSSSKGFTFVEVVVSMGVTVVVMGVIFALLARGFKTTDAVFERSDMQAQARHALDQISRDLLGAGTGLPPEFPAFTPPDVNPELDEWGGGPEAIEIVGAFGNEPAGVDPIPIVSFDGETVTTQVLPTDIEEGDLVLVYDDEPANGSWMLGLVSKVRGGPAPELILKSSPGDHAGDITLPSFIENYNRLSPSSGFITPVTVVSYKTDRDNTGVSGNDRVLWRQVNWGEPTQVAFVESLQFRYFIGTTVDQVGNPNVLLPKSRQPGIPPSSAAYGFGTVDEGNPPPPGDSGEPVEAGRSFENEGLEFPPVPQPDPDVPLASGRLVRGVGITVTSRSHRSNLEGSTVLSGQSPEEAGYLRLSLTSRVATRNVIFRLSTRDDLQGFN